MLYTSFKKRSVKKSNHRDKSLNKNAINAITLSYNYYYKKLRLFKKAYKRFKTLGVLRNLSSSCLIVAGAIAGGVTTNPIVLGIIPDSGFILKTYYEIKDSKKKIELYQIPFSTYVKTLIELGFFLRGVSFDKELFGPTENCRSYHHRLVFNV